MNNITVVICLYNTENFILETLDSLNKQTLKDFNLLIIDDFSTDSSLDKVKRYFKKNFLESTKIVEFEKNMGIAYARNFALNYVKTPLMLFFDADDIAKENLIESLYSKIEKNNDYIAVSCYSQYIDTDSNKIIGGQFIGSINEKNYFKRAKEGKLMFMLPPTLFKREFAIKAGAYRLNGFPSTKLRYQDLSEDLDLWSRMSDFYISGKIMITIPKVLFYYRKNTSSLSASKTNLFAMQNKIRYIKENLKRRRNSKNELDFSEYLNTITWRKKIKNNLKDNSAFYYRNAGFCYVEKSYFLFFYNITVSIVFNPFYIIDKIKSNFIRNT